MSSPDIPAAAAFAHHLHNGRARDDGRHRNNVTRMLRDWRSISRMRDDLIREAAAAGISVRQIHEITGVARTTIARILAGRGGAGAARSPRG